MNVVILVQALESQTAGHSGSHLLSMSWLTDSATDWQVAKTWEMKSSRRLRNVANLPSCMQVLFLSVCSKLHLILSQNFKNSESGVFFFKNNWQNGIRSLWPLTWMATYNNDQFPGHYGGVWRLRHMFENAPLFKYYGHSERRTWGSRQSVHTIKQ